MSAGSALGSLWPPFSNLEALFSAEPIQLEALPGVLTAAFISVLLFLFFVSLFFAFWHFFRAIRSLRFLNRLVAKSTAQDDLQAWRTVKKQAESRRSGAGHLWLEFTEALVVEKLEVIDSTSRPSNIGFASDASNRIAAVSPEADRPESASETGSEAANRTLFKSKYRNTLDAAHFFNLATIAPKLFANRLLAIMPGVLTGVGVLGTFVGLTIGLSAISVNGAPARAVESPIQIQSSRAALESPAASQLGDPALGSARDDAATSETDRIKKDIDKVVQAAATAFKTSVWGVLLSLLFSLMKKATEAHVANKVARYQQKIDSLFERVTAENRLWELTQHSEESRNALQGLAEKIGNTMQKAMVENQQAMADQLNRSLNQTLGPAIRQLVENANQGSEKAIETLLEKFLNRMGDVGTQQRALLDQAASDFSQQATAVGSEFQLLASSIKEMQSGQEQRERALAERNEQAMDALAQRFDHAVGSLSDHVGAIAAEQTKLSDTIRDSVASSAGASQALVSNVQTIKSELEQVAGANRVVGEELSVLAQEFTASANTLKEFANTIQITSRSLREGIETASRTTAALAQQNQSTGQQLGEAAARIDEAQQKALAVGESLETVVAGLSDGMGQFRGHLEQSQERLVAHVEELEQQVARLLNEYGERVQGQTQERLAQWNEQTERFTSSMVTAANALGEVVDEVQSRLGGR